MGRSVSNGKGSTQQLLPSTSTSSVTAEYIAGAFVSISAASWAGEFRRSGWAQVRAVTHPVPSSPPLARFPSADISSHFRSVFNAGCRALLGTINAEQFEREIMRQNVAAPDRHHDDDDALQINNQEDDFVWVEPEPGVRNAAAADGDADGYEPESGNESDNSDVDDEVHGGGGGDDVGVGGAARGAAGAGGRKVSGKRARRGFEERRERQEERRLALQAVGQDEWD